ncbi:MAG TPA: ubiquitin-like protein Pup [Candidatus Methylomirabilis sp.]|jgi:ubiquitin-like protein Pup
MAPEQRQSAPRRATTEDAPAPPASAGTQARGEKVRAALDALIDEIDEALEENAEEFVNSYVQKGGE